MTVTGSAITGVGAYVPDYVLTNAELETMVDTNDEWIRTRTGISERRILKKPGVGTAFLGTEAVKDLLKKTGTKPEEIDGVICATITPEMFFPSTANLICEGAGIKNAFSFDIAAACTGFIYALEIGNNFIKSGMYKKIVVVGSDKMSSITDYTDRNTCILFGDASACVLLEPARDENGIVDTIIRSDGVGKDMLYILGGGSANPSTHETVDKGMHYLYQDGKAVFKYAVKGMADVAVEIMERNHLRGDDVAFLIPHQANLRIIEATANRMGISMDKVTVNINKYGNTTAATIPLCLYEWESKFKRSDNLILAAFGGGFTWGACYLKWAY
jgi:3-oxoacyl-[acyl-carrier-protein] synthase III